MIAEAKGCVKSDPRCTKERKKRLKVRVIYSTRARGLKANLEPNLFPSKAPGNGSLQLTYVEKKKRPTGNDFKIGVGVKISR